MVARIGRRILSRGTAALHDLLIIPIAWLTSYWLRFNLGEIPPQFLDVALMYLLFIVPVQAASFWFFNLYRGVWRFASMPDIARILKSSAIGLAVSLLVLFALFRLEGIPRSVPIIYFVLLILFLSGPRFLYRTPLAGTAGGADAGRNLCRSGGCLRNPGAGSAECRRLFQGGRHSSRAVWVGAECCRRRWWWPRQRFFHSWSASTSKLGRGCCIFCYCLEWY